ncbi:NDP-hexose 2,3-dehydratase family protein [Micromonospora auratinigra]|uniref:Oxidase EvaA n=1 Tax=Micromonospora auratinigra TaxID=261654 RepID=A0A1A8ZFT1_9ACTN|nr:NDP-hexose 2,3-dehydratase family protein [Micromonospora auratinigra]SBT42726.1 oxidase EvaA [Micromonospora auratinigra]
MTGTPGATLIRSDPATVDLAARFTASAAAGDSTVTPNDQVEAWLAGRQQAGDVRVTRIPFADLVGWRFRPDGDLVHDSGKFFSVTGVRISSGRDRTVAWSQPIINQPEIGLLGMVAREFGGVLHFLVQAKMEPGNINTVQLAPTVQATRSNYTGVHRGRGITHLEYFTGPRAGRILVDALQSEQGAWFLNKRNRNIVVEVDEDVPDHEDFRWLTLGQIQGLLRRDDMVNMNIRSILATVPFAVPEDPTGPTPAGPWRESLLRSVAGTEGALHTTRTVLSRLTAAKARFELDRHVIGLDEVAGWHRTADEIAHDEGRFFTVIATDTTAASREVRRWTQPLVAPRARGISAFLVKPIDGVAHLLVRARYEAGLIDVAEFGPTVQCTPDNYPHGSRPRYLDEVLAAPPERVLYDTVQSEEGSRFYRAQSRYLVVAAPDDFPVEVPEDFTWVTLHQATELLQNSYYFAIQARTLLAGLQSTW